MRGKVAVIMFPGNNCEEETRRACAAAGMDAEILRWNTREPLSSYDGFVLPGGWSYEDRIRAGVIAAKDSVMNSIREEAGKRKPVLGICNGAQVLVETGMVPGITGEVQMALASNINPSVKGFYCTWVRVKSCADRSRTAFTGETDKGVILPIPIAHGEGRFTSAETGLVGKLESSGQVVFRYCDAAGRTSAEFPVNPNGSMENIAAVSNPEGNVMAIMPHPERALFSWQVPGSVPLTGGCSPGNHGPGLSLFRSMSSYIQREMSEWR